MKKRIRSRVIASIMLIAAIVFVSYAFSHPEMSFPWNNAVTFILYTAYIVTMTFLFVYKGEKEIQEIEEKSIPVLIVGYGIPYTFLAMYADYAFHTMLMYAVMVGAMGFLAWRCIRIGKLSVLFLGNILSYIISAICIMFFQTKEWSMYFKPFTAGILAIIISIVMLVLQILCWRVRKKK